MTKTQQYLLSLGITVSIIGFLFLLTQRPQMVNGSVIQGSELHATSTRVATTGQVMQSYISLSECSNGVLGSIVITGANTGIINIYDSTTTGAHSQYATTTLATIPASTVAGVYTFDVVATKGSLFGSTPGLVFEMVGGLMPTTTITCR